MAISPINWFYLLILNRPNSRNLPHLTHDILKKTLPHSLDKHSKMSIISTILSLTVIITSVFSVPAENKAIQRRSFLELFPNLIINVDSIDGGAFSAAGYTADMTPTTPTVFSFDIPYDINPVCTLKFELPAPGGLFRYTVTGSGTITAIPIDGVVTTPTSYDTVAPLLGAPYGSFTVTSAGGVGEIGVPCSSGTTLQVVLSHFKSH